jgi:lipoprotein-anchoring transpeptidase ErfK/SrfK
MKSPESREHRVRLLLVTVLVLTATVLAACSGGGSGSIGPAASPTPTQPGPAVVTITPTDGSGGVALTDHVKVTSNAPLQSVTVTRAASASQGTAAGTLEGQLSADGLTWTATGGLFADSQYQVAAQTAPAKNVTGTIAVRSKFVTMTPKNSFKVSWEPVAGQTVGVGTPISLTFSAPAPDRAAVQSRLAVTTDPAVTGAWTWKSNRLIVWRPQQYWRPGTKVHVVANLAGYDAGNSRFGVKDRSMDFVIGPAQISYVDAATHTMRVYSNGVLQRTMAVSLGRPKWPTMDGVHNVIGTAPNVIMDSATVGIPKGDPDYYYETVQWNVQFTSGGLYVHSAPWSEASQGHVNVSHGCVNAAPVDAEWFYHFSRLGDIIDVTNTGRPPDTSQLGNEWSVPWATWIAGSALPVATAAPSTPPAAGTSTPRPATGNADTPTSAVTTGA